MTPEPRTYSEAEVEEILRQSREYVDNIIRQNEAESEALREQLSELHHDFDALATTWREHQKAQEAENARLRARIQELTQEAP